MAAPRLRWASYQVAGRPSGAVKEATDGASGAYAIRRKDSRGVVYVGESHTGRMWRTLARHFQAPESFTKKWPGGANAFATDKPGDYEVAWRLTSRGARKRENGDQRALDLQARWIADFQAAGHRLANVDDGQADDEDDSFEFGANVRANPDRPVGKLTELGALTRLETSKTSYVWSLRNAPALAYDSRGRLFIVYLNRVARPLSRAEDVEYRRAHWGARPKGDLWDGGFAGPPFGARGKAISVTYTTKKGTDTKLVDYVHAFGEGARPREPALPVVLEHVCHGRGCGPRCASRAALFLSGGSYRVTERGIVG